MTGTILILEPHGSGHHAIYVERIAEGCVAAGKRVLLGTTKDFVSTHVKQGWGRWIRPEDIFAMDWRVAADGVGLSQLFLREWRYWNFCRSIYEKVVERVCVDEVFLPYLDYCSNVMGLIGSPFAGVPVYGISMRVNFHFDSMGIIAPPQRLVALKGALFKRFLNLPSVKVVYTIDPSLPRYAQQTFAKELAAKVHYMPDPVDPPVVSISRLEALQRLDIQVQGKVLLLYGSIEPRKGIRWLLEGITNQVGLSGWTILIAGQQTHAGGRLLHQLGAHKLIRSGRLIELNRRITDAEEELLFTISDAIWVNYEDFFQMSGVFVKAACYDKPVLVNRSGVLGYLASHYSKSIQLEDGGQWVAPLKAWFAQMEKGAVRKVDESFRKTHLWSAVCEQLFGR